MDEAITQQAYDITLYQCTTYMCQELETKYRFQAMDNYGDVIDLIKLVKLICYNFKSHKYAPQAQHEAVC